MTVRFESQSEPIAGYRLLERLGSGGFGEVWKAEAPGGIFKAIKIIFGDLRNRETDAFRFAEQELKALKRVKQVRHPYLLTLDRYDIVEGRLMIVMELADCNLWDRFRVCRKQGLPGIPRDELLRYMSESAEVLDLFNDQHQLQHLDIKPQNLFLLYNHVKVADFGQVKDLQGMMASVTGGITPVYAAPETFDGFVSRFCDQYSLACVYQELLTGIRPFDGASMQQLLMQHLQMPPNLAPSPANDRPALMKALSKKPEDRFPSVMAMVDSIKSGVVAGTRVAIPAPPPVANPSDVRVRGSRPAMMPIPEPSLVRDGDSTPPPNSLVETAPPPDRIAPPDHPGSGSLRPVLIIGLGTAGLEVVRRFRRDLQGRYGTTTKLPVIRTLYVDTDPEAVNAAVNAPVNERLNTDDTYLTRLYRAGHYLKPRLNGRTLIEGWFDPQMLYKIPRNPVTLGHRVFGRLAFCDHFRPLMQKIQAELDLCLSAERLAATKAATGLEQRTNRPRVYVVAGLAGGTGGGMFIDMAYALRYRLRRLGYINPDVVGLLIVPPEGPSADIGAQAQANTYAALTELHHFSRPETLFVANYDDRHTMVQDAGPPFSQVYLLPGPVPQPVTRSASMRSIRATGSSPSWGEAKTEREPADAVAEFLRLSILSQLGRVAEEAHPTTDTAAGTEVRTFGMTRFQWPRVEVVDRAARVLSPVLIGNWVSPDPVQVRKVIPCWAADHWGRLGLDPERLAARLSEAADSAAGGRVADVLATTSEHLMPTGGWRGRLPEPDKVSHTLSNWQKLLGRPMGTGNRSSTILDDALTFTADSIAETALAELAVVFPALIESPLFRLAGTEEAIRQILVLLDRTRQQVEQQAGELEVAATATFDLLLTHVNYQKGMRKPTIPEFADAVARYPVTQHRSLLARSVARVYRQMRDDLAARLVEMVALRQRIEMCQPRFATETEAVARTLPGDLLPQGCQTAEDAAQVFLRSLTDDDLHALDARVQTGLENEFGGLYHACLNSTGGLDGLLRVIREEARSYLNDRLGEVDLAGMFYQRYGTGAAVAEQFTRAHTAANPALVGLGPWAQHEVTVFAGPSGLGGDPLRELAAKTLPPQTTTTVAHDEVVLYREYPAVPLAAIPQLGPGWASAYQTAPEVLQITPHARLDITAWIDVDSVME